MFTPNFGEDDPILTGIFFKGVGSTTNQMTVVDVGKKLATSLDVFKVTLFLFVYTPVI